MKQNWSTETVLSWEAWSQLFSSSSDWLQGRICTDQFLSCTEEVIMSPLSPLHICLEQSLMPVNQGAEMNALCFRPSKENQFSSKNCQYSSTYIHSFRVYTCKESEDHPLFPSACYQNLRTCRALRQHLIICKLQLVPFAEDFSWWMRSVATKLTVFT